MMECPGSESRRGIFRTIVNLRIDALQRPGIVEFKSAAPNIWEEDICESGKNTIYCEQIEELV
jgi:hypothetical protein